MYLCVDSWPLLSRVCVGESMLVECTSALITDGVGWVGEWKIERLRGARAAAGTGANGTLFAGRTLFADNRCL